MGQVGRRLQAQHREIRGGVVADQGGLELAPVGQAGGEPGRAGHHVAVGQQVAVGSEDDARTRAAAPLRTLGHDVHDRRPDGVEGVGHAGGVGV